MKFKYPVLSFCSGEPFCREGVIVIEWLMPEIILPRWYDFFLILCCSIGAAENQLVCHFVVPVPPTCPLTQEVLEMDKANQSM